LNMRLVTLLAWLTFCPAIRILPHTKHFAMAISSQKQGPRGPETQPRAEWVFRDRGLYPGAGGL
jgi:hypothetical protein